MATDSTPKFNRIAVEFSRRVSDPVTLDSSGATVVITAGSWLTKAEIEAYVNKAMFKLLETYWTAVNGDKHKMAQVFPDLVEGRTLSFDASQEFSLAGSTDRDIYEVLEAAYNSLYIESPKKNLVLAAQYGALQFRATAQFPRIFKINNKLIIYGLDFSGATSVSVTVFKHPLNYATGGFLTSGGTYDAPFSDMWSSKIAEIAEMLLRIEGNEGGRNA